MKRLILLAFILSACTSNDIKIGDDGKTPDKPGPSKITYKLDEDFESLPVGPIAHDQKVGVYTGNVSRAATGGPSTLFGIDNSKAYSGTKSLKIHIESGETGGGELVVDSTHPLFASAPQHLYGRAMMFFDSSATSNHWDLWGAKGPLPASTPFPGTTARYYFGVTTNGLFPGNYNEDNGMECGMQSMVALPVGSWVCFTWEADAKNIKYRLSMNKTHLTAFDIDTKASSGGNCSGAGSDINTPWYGPVFNNFFFGALSAHPMTGNLNVWVDDVQVDTTNQPTCPAGF